MLKRIFLIVVLLIQVGCSEKTGENRMRESNESRPFYMVKIKNVNAKVFITLNGETIFEDYSKYSINLELPVNQWITSGENTLEVKLLAYNDTDFKFLPKAESSISLRVKEFGEFDNEPLTLSQIIYYRGETTESTKEGNYDFNSSIQEERVSISKLEKDSFFKRQGSKVNGLSLHQKITLKTPFPRWKFLDSDKIIEGNYFDLNESEYYKIRPKEDIETLYDVHQKIYNSLKKGDVDSIIDLFDERCEEMDIAMYKEKGYYKKTIYEALEKNVNDDSMEMLDFNKDTYFFQVSEGGKTAYIKKSILFNKKDGSMNTRYDLLFRKEGNKWVLTR
jgi:hypothetical protein